MKFIKSTALCILLRYCVKIYSLRLGLSNMQTIEKNLLKEKILFQKNLITLNNADRTENNFNYDSKSNPKQITLNVSVDIKNTKENCPLNSSDLSKKTIDEIHNSNKIYKYNSDNTGNISNSSSNNNKNFHQKETNIDENMKKKENKNTNITPKNSNFKEDEMDSTSKQTIFGLGNEKINEKKKNYSEKVKDDSNENTISQSNTKIKEASDKKKPTKNYNINNNDHIDQPFNDNDNNDNINTPNNLFPYNPSLNTTIYSQPSMDNNKTNNELVEKFSEPRNPQITKIGENIIFYEKGRPIKEFRFISLENQRNLSNAFLFNFINAYSYSIVRTTDTYDFQHKITL